MGHKTKKNLSILSIQYPPTYNMISTNNRGTKQPRRTSLRCLNQKKKQKLNNESTSYPGGHIGGNHGAPAMFLIKTYDMLETCDESLAAWTDNGETFTVKDPEKFAARAIPQYFEHSNFSSFARQLNFYGFKKIQMRPVRVEESDKDKPRQVKFHNINFKQGRKDLLSNIFRSTRKNASSSGNGTGSKYEIQTLKDKVSFLEGQLAKMEASFAFMEHQMREMSQIASYSGQNLFAATEVTSKDYSRRSSLLWEESNKMHEGGATLDPSPHVKEIDPALLPAPPAAAMRQISLLRGLSGEFTKAESQLFSAIMTDSSI